MKFKKIIFLMVIVFGIMTVSDVFAFDNKINDEDISKVLLNNTRWSNVVSINTSVEGSSNKVKANAVIITRDNKNANGRLYLQKKNGRSWKTIKSWKINDSGFIKLNKKYHGGVGKYRTKVYINVEGENITVYSNEKEIR